jgi:hypothetical protein
VTNSNIPIHNKEESSNILVQNLPIQNPTSDQLENKNLGETPSQLQLIKHPAKAMLYKH